MTAIISLIAFVWYTSIRAIGVFVLMFTEYMAQEPHKLEALCVVLYERTRSGVHGIMQER